MAEQFRIIRAHADRAIDLGNEEGFGVFRAGYDDMGYYIQRKTFLGWRRVWFGYDRMGFGANRTKYYAFCTAEQAEKALKNYIQQQATDAIKKAEKKKVDVVAEFEYTGPTPREIATEMRRL